MTLPSSPLLPPAHAPGPRWVLHPTLLAAAWVLDIALANQVEPAGFARSLLVAAASATALTLLVWGLSRDRLLGGMVAIGLVVGAISLRPIDAGWELVRAAFGFNAAMGALGGALFVVLAVPALLIVRAMRGGQLLRAPATSVLNRLSMVLVVVVLVYHVIPDLPRGFARATRAAEPVSVHVNAADRPDIYLILVDGYPRADVLERLFGIDNSAFLTALRARGFDVAEESRSNYVFTQLTLTSMFQMRYVEEVDGLGELVGARGAHAADLRSAITSGAAFTALRAAGYGIDVTLPGYEHVALRGAADNVRDHGELNELERELLARTWMLDLIIRVVPDIFAGQQRDRIVHAFDDLDAAAASLRAQAEGGLRGQPRFDWVHIPAPHLPLVLKEDGTTRPLDARLFDPPSVEGFGLTDAEMAAGIAAELQYLNARLLSAVDSLQAATDGAPDQPEPVIVIFSDHGYYYDEADTQARFANFLAASTPGAPGLLDGSPTPINLFPLLLNRYLGTEFALSEDRYFVSPGTLRLLLLTEVADPDAVGPTP